MTSNPKTRRDFLKIATAATLGLGLTAKTAFAQRRKLSCIIIGAGLAGLAAAYKLKKAGWNVIILEARERIGGRVFSHTMTENPTLVCELGAEWVGASHERIIALCKEFGLVLQDHRFKPYLMQNGKVSRPAEWKFSAQAEDGLKKLFAEMKKFTPAQNAALDKTDWHTILKKRGFSDEDLRLRELTDSTDFGESIRFVSGYAAAAEYAESSAENEMDFKITGGNSRLVQEFVKRIGADLIRLNTQVEEINQKAGKVSIKANGEIFNADACICTAPTASLTKIKFNPPLPAIQQKAAESLIYARITKNSVLYDERFWKDENFAMVSDVTSHYYFHSTQNQSGKQGILTSYAIGEKADVLAAQDEKRRQAIITGDLMPFNENAPSLARGFAGYAWQRDKFTRGAYALYRPGQWFGLRPILARPHLNVLFAGEHLADWQGFMEGAIETGESAAQMLIK